MVALACAFIRTNLGTISMRPISMRLIITRYITTDILMIACNRIVCLNVGYKREFLFFVYQW